MLDTLVKLDGFTSISIRGQKTSVRQGNVGSCSEQVQPMSRSNEIPSVYKQAFLDLAKIFIQDPQRNWLIRESTIQ